MRSLVKAVVLMLVMASSFGDVEIQGKGSTFIVNYDPIYASEHRQQIEQALQFWADWMVSEVPIRVEATVSWNWCRSTYGMNATTIKPEGMLNFPNAPLSNTYYPISLANAIAGYDLNPNAPDFYINLNETGFKSHCDMWYMNTDANVPFGSFSFYYTVMQEIAHGLGLMALGTLYDGEKLNGKNDIYWTKVRSNSHNRPITELSKWQIQQAFEAQETFSFFGEHSWAASKHLTSGRTEHGIQLLGRRLTRNKILIGSHLGSSVAPLQLMNMSVFGTLPETDIAIAMLEDLGWRTTRNTPPEITGQTSLSTNEDQPLTLSLNQLNIKDETPETLVLSIADGEHYQVNGQQIVPATNFFGTLTVPVSVADHQYQSNSFALKISVKAVNDAPIITSQKAISIAEDNSLTLNTSHFSISDVDSNTFNLKLLPGEHYRTSGTTLTPINNFNGSLQVGVQASDGSLNSETFTATISVTPVNDAPVVSAQASLSTPEDKAIELTTASFTITDVDSNQFSLEVLPGDNYRLDGNIVIPSKDFNGSLTVPVRAFDGQNQSKTFNAKVSVAAVNDPPVILSQLALSTPEETSIALSREHFEIFDVDSSQFSLKLFVGSNYQLEGNMITPAKDFTGTLYVPIQVSDGTNNSKTFTASIVVTEVNDPPSITGQQVLSFNEDTRFSIDANSLTIEDSDSTSFSIEILNGENYQLSDNKVTPNNDFNGTLNVALRANDGISTSEIYYAQVSIMAVNDAPIIHGQKSLSVDEDTAFTLKLSDLDVTDVDSTELAIKLLPGEHYQTSDEQITPTENFNGLLVIPVTVSDGEIDSELFMVELVVNAINDAPVLQTSPIFLLDEDEAIELNLEQFEFSDVDSNEFQLKLHAGDNYQVIEQQIIPAANYYGQVNVGVQISDGDSLSNRQTVVIDYRPVNDTPVLQAVTAQSIAEDSSLIVNQNILTIDDPDNGTFNLHISRGEHYQVAGNEIIPDENWYGELSINVAVDDGELASNTLPLTVTVLPVNDLPLITTEALNSAQIYRPWQSQLTAVDIDGDALSFSAKQIPDWLNLSAEGLLSTYPNENWIGDHQIEIAVHDGKATTAQWLTLTVLDDPTATNLKLDFAIERTIWAIDAWVPVELSLQNLGPMLETESRVEFGFDGDWQSQDSRCDATTRRCFINAGEQNRLAFSVRQQQSGSFTLAAQVSHDGYEIDNEDNTTQLTLTFSEGEPTQPQYTIPAFGKGDVRAIGLANIQGGRWPEILFANGPTQASTAYKFDGSLFKPVLHSHLADASDSNALALFDFDNDGDKDWVLANGNNEGNTLYRNRGDGFFDYVGSLGQYDSRAVAYADLDGDGDQDLVFANNEQPNTLYLNKGDGSFELFAELPSRRSCRVIIHDFNGDGRPDIFFANRGYRHRILFNRGFGRARANYKSVMEPVAEPISFSTMEFGEPMDEVGNAILADLDGDGIASDLVLATSNAGESTASLEVFSIDSQENARQTAQLTTAAISDLSSGDYDGDGIDELAVLRPGGALEVMQARSDSLQTREVMDTDGADTILMVDVDGSGQADIISANNKANAARLDYAGQVNEQAEAQSTAPEASAPPTSELPNSESSPSGQSVQIELSSGGALSPWWLLLLLWARLRRTEQSRY